MVESTIVYEGGLHCTATHMPSGAHIVTDAPKDNHGRGEAFSPTDLVGAALGTCIVTTMAIVAGRMQVELRGTKVKVVKEMVTAPTRRIGMLAVTIEVPVRLNDEQKQKLMNAALHCPVHKSLHPDVQMPIEFVWA